MADRTGILVVDDTPTSLKLLTDILLAAGHQVRPANCGELALTSVHAQPPELILLDIRMPDMDGFEVCRRLKADPDTQSIPIIFISATTSLEDRVEGFRLGAVDFIFKPFQRGELLAHVNTHLELGHLRAQSEHLAKEPAPEMASIVRELEQTRARLRFVLQMVPSIIIHLSPDHRVLDLNPEAERILKCKREKVLGLDYLGLFVSEHQWNLFSQCIRKALQGEIIRGVETQTIAGDGTQLTLALDLDRLLDSEGKSEGVICVGQPVFEPNYPGTIGNPLADGSPEDHRGNTDTR